ncbi:MAG: ABC transporter permease [Hyphomicrobiaceae bacterium]
MSGAQLTLHSRTDDRIELVAAGAWTAAQANALDAEVAGALRLVKRGSGVTLDVTDVSQLDTYGAWLLERLGRETRSHGGTCIVRGLSERFSGLVAAVHEVPDVVVASARPWSPLSAVARIGQSTEALAQNLANGLNLLGAVGRALVMAVMRPRTFRATSLVHHLDRVAWQAVPIILLITFLIGGIIAQQGFFHFRKFGADLYVVDMVGILVVREIGVLLVAIMVAGRSGSSYTAELGSMKMREEIDAIRTMGLDPVSVLILPRILALVIALPALTFLGVMAALYGGGLVAWLYGDMAPAIYAERLREAVTLTHFRVGMIKAPFMAMVIGIVACAEGLKVQGSAASLGQRTTSSVVKSIFLVIVLDGIFAIYFSAIGM